MVVKSVAVRSAARCCSIRRVFFLTVSKRDRHGAEAWRDRSSSWEFILVCLCSLSPPPPHPASSFFPPECTTGLDSFTSLSILETCRTLARENRTVVCTLHQPRSAIYELLDEVMLLARGRLIFQGTPREAEAFFERAGYPIPDDVNPPDFMLDLLAIETGGPSIESASQTQTRTTTTTTNPNRRDDTGDDAHDRYRARKTSALKRVRMLERAFAKSHPQDATDAMEAGLSQALLTYPSHCFRSSSADPSPPQSPPTPPSNSTLGASPLTQTLLLTRRDFSDLVRDRGYITASFLGAIFCGLLIGLIFFQLPLDTLAGIRSRTSGVYMTATLNYYLSMIFYIYKFSLDLPVADFERADRLYGIPAFVLSRILVYLPFKVFFSLVYIAIVYPLIGLRSDAGSFFIAVGAASLLLHASVAISFLCVCIQRPFAQSSLIGNALFTFFSLSGGFLVASEAIPIWLQWVQKISYCYYGWRFLATNEYSGRSFTLCADSSNPASCTSVTGDSILDGSYLYSDDWAVPIRALIIIWAVALILATVALRLIPVRVTMAGEVGSREDEEVEAEEEDEIEKNSLGTECDAKPLENSGIPALNSPISSPRSPGVGYGSIDSDHNRPVPRRTETPSHVRFHDAGESDTTVVSEGMVAPVADTGVERVAILANTPSPSPSPSSTPSLASSSSSSASHVHRQPVTMSLHNLNLAVRKRVPPSWRRPFGTVSEPIPILQKVTATIKPGLLVAIIGQSGCGKSTLLDLCARRSSLFDDLKGEILFNGVELDKSAWSGLVGYVAQSDFLLPYCTVRETFQFVARLRLTEMGASEREARVLAVIQELGLVACADTIVGGRNVKGISGGELRRVSIGCSMLTDPSVLLLDGHYAQNTSRDSEVNICRLLAQLAFCVFLFLTFFLFLRF